MLEIKMWLGIYSCANGLPKNKEATPRFAKQIVPAGKTSLLVYIAWTFLE
ncbi:protein of unknown function [Petrocella atlantisensis]|uniref:Uncharacterized protein n=1 Tax=Petrocella atlantisensis TaxID=2173034 RepID=A0A3P7NZ18_9FIRM|nr:protein of unknown function [Petrocella atlantisensis]